MPLPFESFIEALNVEIEAIRKDTSSSVLELRGGIKQGTAGSDTLYSFPLGEEPNLRDDSPVKIIVAGKEVDGTVVSIRNGVLTVAVVEDLGTQIPLARLVVNDSFLIERLRDKLAAVQRGECSFNARLADSALHNSAGAPREVDVPDDVFALGNELNALQRRAVRLTAGSSLVYVWGPPGTGKTSTLAATVHALYLQGKSILIVSNTNIAVDTALERIGDRLSTLPEFNEAAILRFGPIVSDTLRAKYEAQVDLEKVVERHSAALVQKKAQLNSEANHIQAVARTLTQAIQYYDSLRAAEEELRRNEGKHRQAQRVVEEEQCGIASLDRVIQHVQTDLLRVRTMGAIRRFFSGLNEEVLLRSLTEAQARIQNNKKAIASATIELRKIEADRAACQEAVRRQQKEVSQCQPESACRGDLQRYNQRLKQVAGEMQEIDEQLQAMRAALIAKCRVLATTVYQSYLKDEVARQYDVVIVDEASMLALPMVCYASGLAKEKVVVAGDFRQLPPIVLSKEAVCDKWLKRDIFHCAEIADAVRRKEYPASLVALQEQFRMNDDVCGLVNHFFYDNHLQTAQIARNRQSPVPPFDGISRGLIYVDTSDWNPWAAFRLGTYSRYNVLHALLVRAITIKLQAKGYLGSEEINDRLGIVSPYSAQCRLLAQLVGEALNVRGSLYAATVHRFQGNERDTIICDLTESVGARVGRFVKAESLEEDGARLLNVALSRARHSTLLIANFHFLRQKLPAGAIVRDILDYFEEQGAKLDVSDCLPFKPEEILAGHQAATGAAVVDVERRGITFFTAGTFFPAFENECRDAKSEIVIFSPYMTERGTARWVELLRAKMRSGVHVRLVTRPPGDQGGSLEHGLAELIDSLRAIGIAVDERKRMHEKMAFIDGDVLWHGSLNILSHKDTTESMLRVESAAACTQVGAFVVGRRSSNREQVNLAQAENPTCASCGRSMIWNNGRYGIWFDCGCGEKADAYGRPKRTGKSPARKPADTAKTAPRQIPSVPGSAFGNCPLCGKPLEEKKGRYGQFVGCTGYRSSPRCRYTRSIRKTR